MFFRREKKDPDKDEMEILKNKMDQILYSLESFTKDTDKKMHLLEKGSEQRLKEVESKLDAVEEKVWLLNQVLASLNPDKRIN